ncbi:hypothetical protein EWH99_12805 [Sporolactobacillus sp. THM7-7]|nr:hypothetical protein EWH99_12805 [Sporolactobacillus sp. THM7-7]
MIAWLKAFLQRYRFIFYMIPFSLMKKLRPMQKNKVLLFSDSRGTLSGNLLFIDKELKKYPFEVRTVLKAGLKTRRPLRDMIRLPYHLATSAYIIVDDFCPVIYPLRFRKEQKVIQAWHAIGAFKKMGFSRVGKAGGPIAHSITHRNYTDAIVSSPSIKKNYAEAFRMDEKKIHVIGAPRTDVFFDRAHIDRVRRAFFGKHPDFLGKKIVLFAPTFRGKGQKAAYYDFSWIDFDRLEARLGEDYRVIIKCHPFVPKLPAKFQNSCFYTDLSAVREINDLLFIADLLITDYSSVIFEYALLRKPIVYFVPDLEAYRKTRDFYYPFNKYVYGPTTANTEQLAEAIVHAGVDEERLDTFIRFFCSACDGRQSEKFVKALMMHHE